jgi:UDP-2,3-diacylglucosamine hydrolase
MIGARAIARQVSPAAAEALNSCAMATSVLEPPCYVLSDAHIGVGSPWDAGERSLLAFLRSIAPTAGSVVINGDLFDFWFEWRTVIPRSGFRVVAALAELTDRGTPVLWVAGNHDCWGGDVLRRDAGIDYHVGPWVGSVGGWRARVEHGDGLRDREDRKYRAFRRVARHPLAVRAYRWLPADLATRLATGSSRASRVHSARDGGAGLRAVAERTLAGTPELDLLIFGHSHVPTLARMPGGGVYANAGAWIAGPGEPGPTFLSVRPERLELRRWTESGEMHVLDGVDRVGRAEKALGGAAEVVRGVGGDEPVGR